MNITPEGSSTSKHDSRSDWSSQLYPAAITTEAVASRRFPVLRVVHEEGHSGWQFYDDAEPLTSPVVLEKDVFLRLDPSLASVTDLPVGWEAVRQTATAPWHRRAL